MTKIEEVARAMAEEIGSVWVEMSEDPYAPIDISRPFFRRIARAAVEALREPTEEMCDAGADCLDTNDPADYCPSAGQMERAWQAMLSAILKEEVE